MLRKFHWHSFAIIVVLTTAFLTACGANSSGGSGLTGTITYWYNQSSPDGTQAMQQIAQSFATKYPGAHINLVGVPKDQFDTKLSTAIATGTAPDASVNSQTSIARFVKDGDIVAVPDGLVNESTFFKSAFETNRVNGTVWGLPQGQTCIALYYNKDLVATPPTTWDEFIADAQQAYNPAKKIAAVGFPTSGGYAGWMFTGFIAQAGGTLLDEQNKVVTFAQQPGVDALNLWKTLYSYSPAAIVGSQNSFATGHVAFLISGPWEVPGFKQNFPDFHWGVTLLPMGKEQASNLGGENGVVYKTSKHQQLAWAWLKYLSTDANVTLNDKVTQNFPITMGSEDPNGPFVKAEPARAVFLHQLQYATLAPTDPNWVNINDNVLGKAVENTLLKGMSAQDAMTVANQQAKTILGW